MIAYIDEQCNNMKASMQIGDWRLRDQQEIEETPQLSCFNDTILESCVIDIGILDSIWEKAAQLAHTEGFVTPIPGEFGEKEKMVASSSSMQPHMVTVGRKKNNVFVIVIALDTQHTSCVLILLLLLRLMVA